MPRSTAGDAHSIAPATGRRADEVEPARAAMNDEFARTIAFEQWVAARASTHTQPVEVGDVYLNDHLPDLWDRNFVWLDERATNRRADELADIADDLLGRANARHRKILVAGEHLSAQAAADFEGSGWSRTNLVVMAWRGEAPSNGLEHGEEEVGAHEYRSLTKNVWAEGDEKEQIAVSGQLMDLVELMTVAGNARFFAVRAEGAIVSGCHLYSDGATAQIEDVATLRAHRGRGHANAVVRRALDVALDAGHDLVFLVADEYDWPRTMYEKLGFEIIGRHVDLKLENVT